METCKICLFFLFFGAFYIGLSFPLESSKYEEAGCAATKPAPNINADFTDKTALWYVSMASAYFYHKWAEKLTNESTTPTQLQHICLKISYLAPDTSTLSYTVAANGFKTVVTYKCSSSHQLEECDGVPGSPGYEPGVESVDTVVATDNKNYLLTVQCIKKKLKAWYVLSPTEDELPVTVKQEALQAALNLGFNKDYESSIDYKSCSQHKK